MDELDNAREAAHLLREVTANERRNLHAAMDLAQDAGASHNAIAAAVSEAISRPTALAYLRNRDTLRTARRVVRDLGLDHLFAVDTPVRSGGPVLYLRDDRDQGTDADIPGHVARLASALFQERLSVGGTFPTHALLDDGALFVTRL